MKGVNNKSVNTARVTKEGQKPGSTAGSKGKQGNRAITAKDLIKVNRRLDQCLPLETPEWERVQQLLMQASEFAPTDLVYEMGMAIAIYADDQARRAYLLAAQDAGARSIADLKPVSSKEDAA